MDDQYDDEVQDEPGSATDGFFFDVPEPMEDAPPPSTEKVRHIKLADGKHWVKVKGGATAREAMYIDHLRTTHLKNRYASPEEERQALYAYNRGLATWIADRVVDHNLTYPGTDEKLPTGMGLYYELPPREALRLIAKIQQPPSFFVDPKADKSSPGG